MGIKEFMKNVNHVEIIYNIPYNPQTNPIEMFFSEFKNNYRNKVGEIISLTDEIESAIEKCKEDNLTKYFEKSLIKNIETL